MDTAQGRALAFHSLEIRRHPVAGDDHAGHEESAEDTTCPDFACLQDWAWEHGSSTHPPLPQDEYNAHGDCTADQADDGGALPGVRVSASELEAEEKHDGSRDEEQEANEIQFRYDFSTMCQ